MRSEAKIDGPENVTDVPQNRGQLSELRLPAKTSEDLVSRAKSVAAQSLIGEWYAEADDTVPVEVSEHFCPGGGASDTGFDGIVGYATLGDIRRAIDKIRAEDITVADADIESDESSHPVESAEDFSFSLELAYRPTRADHSSDRVRFALLRFDSTGIAPYPDDDGKHEWRLQFSNRERVARREENREAHTLVSALVDDISTSISAIDRQVTFCAADDVMSELNTTEFRAQMTRGLLSHLDHMASRIQELKQRAELFASEIVATACLAFELFAITGLGAGRAALSHSERKDIIDRLFVDERDHLKISKGRVELEAHRVTSTVYQEGRVYEISASFEDPTSGNRRSWKWCVSPHGSIEAPSQSAYHETEFELALRALGKIIPLELPGTRS